MRAIAVLAVLGFHGEVGLLRGGFVGVDVFFVISGYLISGIIFRALEKGTFSFAEFYVRRINRIFPALITVLATTLILGWPILYPAEFANLGHHVIGGSGFVSNLVLWSEAGYFDSQSKPLLHLWSLGVEEQFYLLWPVVAIVAWKRRWNVSLLLIAIIVGSFALNLLAIHRSLGIAAFYSPVTRFWEILAGALLCIAEITRSRDDNAGVNRLRENLASVLGLALLFVALVTVDRSTPWPGWQSLLPVGGTLLLIAAGSESFLNKHVLGNRLVVAIGLISYPLYLWHWPLMVYARLVNGEQVPRAGRVGLILLSVILSALTYQFIEKPIRFGAHKGRSAKRLLPVMAAAALVGVLVSAAVVRARLDASFTNLVERAAKDETPGGQFVDGGKNLLIFSSGDSVMGTTAFLGDSHAAQYRPRFEHLADAGKTPRVEFLTYGGCPPLPGINHLGVSWDGSPFRCDFVHAKAMELARQPDVRSVVYTAWWEAYFNQRALYLLGDGSRTPIKLNTAGADSLFDLLENEIENLISLNKKVFIILSNPSGSAYDPYTMLPQRLPGRTTAALIRFVAKDSVLAAREPVAQRLRDIATRTGANIIDPADYLCAATECPTVNEHGEPIYRDGHHLRRTFARNYATFVDQVIN